MKSFIEINFHNSFNRGSSSGAQKDSADGTIINYREKISEAHVISASQGTMTAGNISNDARLDTRYTRPQKRNWVRDIIVGAIGSALGSIITYLFL